MKAITLITLLALAVRLASLAATPDLGLAADPANYDLHARSIAAGDGYPDSTVTPAGGPTAIRPPGFPFFLGAVYAVTGDSQTAGRVAQAVLGALAVLLIALVARELFGARVALVAGVMAAVFPPFVLNGITLLSEPLFVVLELSAVLAVLRARRPGAGVGWVVAAGALCGLAFLTRANALALVLVLALALREPGSLRSIRAWRAPALLVVCAALVVAPWTIRNAVEFGRFIPVSTQDGFTLAGTYNATSEARDAIWIPANIDPAMRALLDQSRDLDEAALNARLRSAAREFALDHAGYVPSVAWHNLRRLVNLGGTRYERIVAGQEYGLGHDWARLMVWSTIPLLILAAAGAFTAAARRAPLWVWALPVLFATTVFVLATNRHRAAIDPFLLMLAALAVVPLYERVRRRSP
jgi:4-amino-4-deoxy-L-arabinose transferase-like glycosyltransferase